MPAKVLFYSPDEETCGLYEMIIGADFDVVAIDDPDEAINYLCHSHEHVDLALIHRRGFRAPNDDLMLAAEDQWVPVITPVPVPEHVNRVIRANLMEGSV